jgi:hypothetical protein
MALQSNHDARTKRSSCNPPAERSADSPPRASPRARREERPPEPNRGCRPSGADAISLATDRQEISRKPAESQPEGARREDRPPERTTQGLPSEQCQRDQPRARPPRNQPTARREPARGRPKRGQTSRAHHTGAAVRAVPTRTASRPTTKKRGRPSRAYRPESNVREPPTPSASQQQTEKSAREQCEERKKKKTEEEKKK